MTATKQFLEDMAKGGYFGEYKTLEVTVIGGAKYHDDVNVYIDGVSHRAKLASYLLDPASWLAVGKTRGWSDHYDWHHKQKDWHGEWHQFISFLANHLSIEEALAKLV